MILKVLVMINTPMSAHGKFIFILMLSNSDSRKVLIQKPFCPHLMSPYIGGVEKKFFLRSRSKRWCDCTIFAFSATIIFLKFHYPFKPKARK